MTNGIRHRYTKIKKSALLTANISKFRKNAKQKTFKCLFGMNSPYKTLTVPLHWVRVTGIAYK